MKNITAEIYLDSFFGALSLAHRLLWIGIITAVADDQGRMEDNVAVIRSSIFPYDSEIDIKEVEQGLKLFAKRHRIDRYVAGTNGSGRRLMQIVNWWKYQRKAQWANRSIYPPPRLWVDRIRTHDKGSQDIVTVNWEHLGGYVATTKEYRSVTTGYVASNEAATNPIREKEEDSLIKDSLSLSKADREFLDTKHPDWINDAIDVANSKGIHDPKYVTGILKNWIAEGRKEHAKPKRRNPQRTNKPGSQKENPSAATRNAAARILAKQRSKSNV